MLIIRRIGALFAVACFSALMLVNFFVQQYYVDRSRALPGSHSASFAEIPNASESHLLDHLVEMQRNLQATKGAVLSDTYNIVLAKIESRFTVGHSTLSPSGDFGTMGHYAIAKWSVLQQFRLSELVPQAERLSSALFSHYEVASFKAVSGFGHQIDDKFVVDKRISAAERDPNDTLLLGTSDELSPLNRWQKNDESRMNQLIFLRRLSQVRNYLVFVTSDLGRSYFARDESATIFQLESDPMLPNATMCGINRYMLLELLNPTRDARLELDFTATIRSNGEDRLPPVRVFGERQVSFNVIGRGSARVLAPVVKPRIIDGRAFLLLDMGIAGSRFQRTRTGLMALYGRRVLIDSRLLTAFFRDLSLVSERDISAAPAPEAVSHFPTDLQNPALFYSGIYEDGWVAEASQVRLLERERNGTLIVKGMVPQIDNPTFHTTLRLLVDDRTRSVCNLRVGYFVCRVSGVSAGTHTIRALFSHLQRLPAGDRRPVSARFSYLGFEKITRSVANSEAR